KSQQRPRLTRAPPRGHARALHRRNVVRVCNAADVEQARGTLWVPRARCAVEVDDCELRLSFDVAVICRPFEPAYPFGTAGRNANAIEIAASDAVLNLRQPGTAGAG